MQGLAPAVAGTHVAQFYAHPGERDRAVVDWIRPALEKGAGAILICTPANAAAVRDGLRGHGLDPVALERAGRLHVVRARDLMSRFIDDEGPRPVTFRALAHDLVVKVRMACGDRHAEVRAWGEMVHLLWEGGRPDAAHRLEELWNEALPDANVHLLCSYDVSNSTPEARAALKQNVLGTHACLHATGRLSWPLS